MFGRVAGWEGRPISGDAFIVVMVVGIIFEFAVKACIGHVVFFGVYMCVWGGGNSSATSGGIDSSYAKDYVRVSEKHILAQKNVWINIRLLEITAKISLKSHPMVCKTKDTLDYATFDTTE